MMLTAKTNEMSLGFPSGATQQCVKLTLSLNTKITYKNFLIKMRM
jgi:hypothetical protein